MVSHGDDAQIDRRALLKGATLVGVTAMLSAVAMEAGPALATQLPPAQSNRKYPAPWPEQTPYGLVDNRIDLWPRDDNSMVLPLELRPRDEELGHVWIRDTYVNFFKVNGHSVYVAAGTTRVPGLSAAQPWNDGIFVWTSPSMNGPWTLADTTGIRPDAEKGKVWSPEFVGENTPGRTVVAPWQEYWYDTKFGKRGEVWAPEVHYFNGRWYIVACMGDHSKKVGSFLLVSDGGVEGPYRLATGNLEKPFGDPTGSGPAVAKPEDYYHIDGSMFTEGDAAWLVLHNSVYARFSDDMEDIIPDTALPAFEQATYSPEPYLEGAYVFSYGGKYYLTQAAWDRASTNPDGSTRYAYDTPAPGRVQYQYDAIMAVADKLEGPYSPRWTLGVGCGGNSVFQDESGHLWTTFFRNPAQGYWADPSRLPDTAVPGVVRVEWTGPDSNRLYVQRRNHGQLVSG